MIELRMSCSSQEAPDTPPQSKNGGIKCNHLHVSLAPINNRKNDRRPSQEGKKLII